MDAPAGDSLIGAAPLHISIQFTHPDSGGGENQVADPLGPHSLGHALAPGDPRVGIIRILVGYHHVQAEGDIGKGGKTLLGEHAQIDAPFIVVVSRAALPGDSGDARIGPVGGKGCAVSVDVELHGCGTLPAVGGVDDDLAAIVGIPDNDARRVDHCRLVFDLHGDIETVGIDVIGGAKAGLEIDCAGGGVAVFGELDGVAG